MHLQTTHITEEKYQGLSQQQAQKKLQELGKNVILKKTRNSAFSILIRQFNLH